MGALEELAAALAGESVQKQIAAQNPYYNFGAVPDAYSQVTQALVAKNPGAYSNKEIYGNALISGLVGGALSHFGDGYQDTLTDRYQKATAASALGQAASGEGLPSGLFRQAQQAGSLFRLKQTIEDRNSAKAFEQERAGKVQDLLAQNGYLVGSDGGITKIDALDPAQIDAKKEAAKKTAGLEAENKFWGGDKSENPDNPKVKAAKGLETETYNRITKLPAYTQFSDIDNNFKTLLALTKEDSRSASVGMISALARIWDPGGTVREGEYALNSNAQSALDSVIGNWREVVEGKGKLQPEGKKAIVSAAAQKYNEFGKAYATLKEQNLAALEQQGGSRANIPTLEFSPYDIATFQGADGAVPAGMKLQRNTKTGETRLVPR